MDARWEKEPATKVPDSSVGNDRQISLFVDRQRAISSASLPHSHSDHVASIVYSTLSILSKASLHARLVHSCSTLLRTVAASASLQCSCFASTEEELSRGPIHDTRPVRFVSLHSMTNGRWKCMPTTIPNPNPGKHRGAKGKQNSNNHEACQNPHAETAQMQPHSRVMAVNQ
jgi:hypothetical protein